MMIEKKNRLPILMTASISTNGMKGACFTDEEREMMYLQTLQFYIRAFKDKGQKIVFVDNSGWDMEAFKAKLPVTDFVEYISLDKNMFDISKGKGYNELLLINLAVEQSRFIKDAGGFFKVTGRYPIYNLDYFVTKSSKYIANGGQFYGDMKDHKLYDWLHLGWNGHSGEARLFGCRNEWYMRNLGSRYTELNDSQGRIVENLLFDVLKQTNDNVSKRFDCEPYFAGLDGSDGNAIFFSKNQDDVKGKIKRYVGNAIRILMPWFWF